LKLFRGASEVAFWNITGCRPSPPRFARRRRHSSSATARCRGRQHAASQPTAAGRGADAAFKARPPPDRPQSSADGADHEAKTAGHDAAGSVGCASAPSTLAGRAAAAGASCAGGAACWWGEGIDGGSSTLVVTARGTEANAWWKPVTTAASASVAPVGVGQWRDPN